MVKLRKYLPDWKMEIKDNFASGDRVCIQFVLTGTFSGESYFGIQPTNRTVTSFGTDILNFRNNKVVSEFVAFDDLHFFTSLGIPPLSEVGDLNLKNLHKITKCEHAGTFDQIEDLISDKFEGIVLGRGLKGEGRLRGSKGFLHLLNLNKDQFMKAEFANKKFFLSSDGKEVTTISTEMVGGQPKWEWNSVWEFDDSNKLVNYRLVAADCSGMSVA
jgi:hypothetical protein